MHPIEKLVSHYRPELIRLAEHDLQIPWHEQTIRRFVDQIMEDWYKHFAEADLPPATRQEMAFWYCLYDIEMLSEIPSVRKLCEFELMQFDTLREIRERLRRNEPLPDGYYVSRPTEPFTDDYGDNILFNATVPQDWQPTPLVAHHR